LTHKYLVYVTCYAIKIRKYDMKYAM